MSFRDFLWDYPVNLKKIYISLIPLSHILFFSIFAIGFFFLIFNPAIYKHYVNSKKTNFVEGVVGTKNNLNPLFLNSNQVDRDLQELIFTKFINLDSQGYAKQGLAKSWSVSSDFKTYFFNIRDDMYWQDGIRVSADDVVFTFNFAKELYSKYSSDTFGQGISTLTVEKTGDYSVKFVLSDLNATIYEMVSVYIVPKHILEDTNIQTYAFTRFSELPIGSGPFKVVKSDDSSVLLSRNPYFPEKVSLSNFEMRFFNSTLDLESAFRANQLDGMGVYLESDIPYINEYVNFDMYSFDLPFRKKTLFFNTRNSKFSNSSIRKGIGYLIDKGKLLNDLEIDGTISNGSIPTPSWAYQNDLEYLKYDQAKADIELKAAGYTKNAINGFYTSTDGKILTISLTYLDTTLNETIVNYISNEMEKEGIIINTVPNTYDQITRETLASRDFEMILYEVEVSVDPDQYNLWHSLKIDYPNLNISGFKLNRLDIYLERGRQLLSRTARLDNYINFQKALLNESPALFLYEPKYFYIIRKDVEGFGAKNIKYPQERFNTITKWNFD